MGRYRRGRRCAFVHALSLLGLVGATPAAAIDLSGVYVSQVIVLSVPCTLTFAQSGTALTVTGPCNFFGTTYTFDLAGTVDPMTGAFSANGPLIGLCEAPNSVTMTGTGDGEVFSANADCGPFISSPVTGTKCGNGMVDATEDCEDGNTAAGDCCSPTCQFNPSGSACAADTNACTRDVCDGAGHCQHLPDASGSPCTDDLNGCTDDVCDAGGQCTHPANAGSCDDSNACTTPDTCTLGTCVGGPIAPACLGPIDLTGDWELTPSAPVGMFSPSGVRHFAQSGAVLESHLDGMVGVGSVNPAMGEFASYTPFVVLIFPCVELIAATATADAQSFSGTLAVDCGLEGSFGPFPVSGRRCAPGSGCACATDAPCTLPDSRARLVIRAGNHSAPTRWWWTHSGMPPSFGDPTTSSDYQLCVETSGGSFIEVALHGNGWRATRSGFRYRADSGVVRKLVLRSTAKKTVVAASLVPAALPALPLAAPVRVRLVRTDADPVCFETEFTSPTANTSSRYRATQ